MRQQKGSCWETFTVSENFLLFNFTSLLVTKNHIVLHGFT